MSYGITGPDKGLTLEQERFVADTTLVFLYDTDDRPEEFWSGCAYVVDTIGVMAAERARVPLIGLVVPQVRSVHGPRPLWSNATRLINRIAELGGNEVEYVVEYAPPGRDASDGYMKRNAMLVSKIDCLLAFPETSKSRLRSGTWSTVRRARDAGIRIHFYPLDGSPPWTESELPTLFDGGV